MTVCNVYQWETSTCFVCPSIITGVIHSYPLTSIASDPHLPQTRSYSVAGFLLKVLVWILPQSRHLVIINIGLSLLETSDIHNDIANRDNTWTDKTGRCLPLGDIADSHLLNIQAMLKRTLKNPQAQLYQAGALIDRYCAEYSDKDWFSIPEYPDIDDVQGETRIALMKISQEVNRRR